MERLQVVALRVITYIVPSRTICIGCVYVWCAHVCTVPPDPRRHGGTARHGGTRNSRVIASGF